MAATLVSLLVLAGCGPDGSTFSGRSFALGETAAQTTTGATVQVIAFEAGPVAAPDTLVRPQPGFRLAAAEVEVCAGKDRLPDVNPDAFLLRVPGRDEVAQTVSARQPVLDLSGLRRGDCARGWLTFPVPEGREVTAVLYQDGDTKAQWRLV